MITGYLCILIYGHKLAIACVTQKWGKLVFFQLFLDLPSRAVPLGGKSMNRKFFFVLAAIALLLSVVAAYQPAGAQVTLSTGSIEGTLTDPQGAAVPGAKVSITSKATGATTSAIVNSSGSFTSGPLAPGEYVVKVEASGFKTLQQLVTVQVANVANASAVLALGSATSVVTVEAGTEMVNTEQATIQGVVTQDQIENLPINGRNFLDLAQLQPGVQIQDGGNFDPTKKGFSSVSFRQICLRVRILPGWPASAAC